MEVPAIVIKIGGNEVDAPGFLAGLVETIGAMQRLDGDTMTSGRAQPVIVHGGGKEIARLQNALGIAPAFIEGLRVTDEASLDVAEMVLSGLVNKRLVARLVDAGVAAVGVSGVDFGLIRVEKMAHPAGDLGWVGRIVEVHTQHLDALLQLGLTAVISPISLGTDGHTYNVNADHAATAVALALKASQLIFVSNVPGVLIDGRVVPQIRARQAEEWIESGKIHGGMVPKVRSALQGVTSGIAQVRITNLEGLRLSTGTILVG
jgi:acetylglutamate kinase